MGDVEKKKEKRYAREGDVKIRAGKGLEGCREVGRKFRVTAKLGTRWRYYDNIGKDRLQRALKGMNGCWGA